MYIYNIYRYYIYHLSISLTFEISKSMYKLGD